MNRSTALKRFAICMQMYMIFVGCVDNIDNVNTIMYGKSNRYGNISNRQEGPGFKTCVKHINSPDINISESEIDNFEFLFLSQYSRIKRKVTLSTSKFYDPSKIKQPGCEYEYTLMLDKYLDKMTELHCLNNTDLNKIAIPEKNGMTKLEKIIVEKNLNLKIIDLTSSTNLNLKNL